MEQAKQAYGELVNDEVMWKDLSDKFMKGDTNPLLSMVDSMETQLAQMIRHITIAIISIPKAKVCFLVMYLLCSRVATNKIIEINTT